MIKHELVENIVKKFNIEEIKAADFVDSIFSSISGAFEKGKNVNIPEFGKFGIVSKSVNGKRLKYVSFSPAKRFADDINENFTDLKPVVTSVFGLKKDELLIVREVMPDESDEDYLCFIFEESGGENEESSLNKDNTSSADPVNQDVFGLPGEQKKFVHDLQDEFSTEDVNNEFVNLFVKKEEILDELNLIDTKKTKHENEVNTTAAEDEIIIEPASKTTEDDIILHSTADLEVEKTVPEEEQGKEEKEQQTPVNFIGAFELPKTSNIDLYIFQKLLGDLPAEKTPVQKTEDVILSPREEIKEPVVEQKKEEVVQDEVKHEEFTSLSDALSNIDSGTFTVESTQNKPEEDKKSFSEIFETNKDTPVTFKPKEHKKPVKKRSGIVKLIMFLPLFILAVALIFYLIRLLFTSLDIIPEHIKESERKQVDAVNGESVEVENYYDVIFRKLGKDFYIQNKVFDSVAGANEQKSRLNSVNIPNRVEAAMSMDNRIQYRILVGPFDSVEKAKEYFEVNKANLSAFR